ncbi:transcription factor sdnS [Sarocladium implicatum]|nr:transcription factor sdnS [Sarocladium implicatum]
MERLVEQSTAPDDNDSQMDAGSPSRSPSLGPPSTQSHKPPSHGEVDAVPDCRKPSDLLNSSAAGHALSALGHTTPGSPGLITPDASPVDLTSPSLSVHPETKCHRLSRQIHSLIPSRQTLKALASRVPGVPLLFAVIHGPDPSNDGHAAARLEDILHIPDPTSHPALLSRKLLAVCYCLQQLPYDFDMSSLHCSRSAVDIINDAMALITTEITCHDAMLTCLEGIECLMLQGLIYSDAGLIRKAWMTGRHVLNIQQLMGLDRKTSTGPIRSCDPNSDPARRPPPGLLWFRASSADRYNSLILGLPVASRDNSFSKQEFPEWDIPFDVIGRVYAVISGKISRRNESTAEEELSDEVIYTLTQTIDADLIAAAATVSEMWWEQPGAIRECSESNCFMPEMSTVKLQVRHFTLVMLLHLPYLLRQQQSQSDDPYAYNRKRCMDASRAVVKRFLDFRKPGGPITSGRSVDYSALVASMTLVIGHASLRRDPDGPTGSSQDVTERARDWKLAERARDIMGTAGKQWGDKLAAESAELLTKLLRSAQSDEGELVCLWRRAESTGAIPPCVINNFAQPGAAGVCGTMDFLREGPTMLQADADWSWLGSSADLDQWALHDADSMYWSMLNQGS